MPIDDQEGIDVFEERGGAFGLVPSMVEQSARIGGSCQEGQTRQDQ
jgi:hypothetical protein